ncbi:hypothetical protein [Actinoplanes auranticolor]|uniref:Uncharacterized protein n=1 Tax=Actinoplanes auranticolor TaxID=47988 RepID=A0A919SLG0_9ACTN|nr:hypothetical protein [Actinoplanes auranticolor]GIM74296.1 hypothetical protein Aau02nite_60280 [Actinoplanes auranticolor]
MPATSDRAVLLAALRGSADLLFVTPDDELVTQEEVHHEAREQIRRRGLPPDTPYAGWHTPASAFDRKGSLRRPQAIYFGGDRETVGRALRRLEPAGYAVFGGRSDTEAFLLVRDARPTAADPAQLDDWRVRLALLSDPNLTVGQSPTKLPVPLRDGEEALLHTILASSSLAPVHRQTFLALGRRHLLVTDDIDHLLSTWRTVFAEDPSAFARAALDSGHPAAGRLIGELLADGAATADLLWAWGDPAALPGCRRLALRGDSIDVYLRLAARAGTAPGAAAIALATEMRATPDPDPAVQKRRMEALCYALPAAVGDPDLPVQRAIVNTLRDGTVPAWLRAELARLHAYLPFRLRSELNRLTYPSDGRRPSPRPAIGPDESRAVLAEWDEAVDGARRAAGLPPWPGFDPEDARCREAAVELLDEMAPGHLAGLRACSAHRSVSEPGTAACLYLLTATSSARAQDLAAVAERWPELFVAPTPYTTVPPALLTLVRALRAAGDPLADTVTRSVLADRNDWSRPLRHLLAGEMFTDEETATRLWTIAASTSSTAADRDEAAQAFVLLDSRRSGESPRQAAARAYAAAAVPKIPFVGRAFIVCAVALAEPRRPLWGYFGQGSVRWLSAALLVAEDEELPADFRRATLDLARRSTILSHPARVRLVAADRTTTDGLRSRFEQISARLLTA